MECGYYVMRYMKEIVEDENLSFAVKVQITILMFAIRV